LYAWAAADGTVMETGLFSGSGWLILSSGNTTSVAHVLSLVRVKTSDIGAPFVPTTSLGENPFASTVTATDPPSAGATTGALEGDDSFG